MNPSPFLPTRLPNRTLETAAFWDACAEGRLSLPKCDVCGEFIWYPRLFCPFCASNKVTYTDVIGVGTVYSFTVIRRGAGVYREYSPYVLAYVQLAEGPVVMTNVVGVDPETVRVGQRVRVIFEPAQDASGEQLDAIPRFTPTGAEPPE